MSRNWLNRAPRCEENERAGDVVEATQRQAQENETEPHDPGIAGRIRLFSENRPRLTAWIIVVLLLGMWGFWAGPRWSPEPLRSSIVPETSDTDITLASPTPQLGAYEIKRTDVEITLRDGEVIKARVTEPIGVEGLAPGLAFIHGTGTDGIGSFDTVSSFIASTGIVTIVPEKRTTDYSLTHRDYRALANDYEDVFTYLINKANVDPHRSGLYAVSEGCFIAPIIASRNTSVAHVSFVSAPVLPIRSQGALAADTYLRNLGAPETMIRAISKLIGQQFGDDFQYVDFDVSQYQEKMTMPVLMLYGTGDMSMPMVQGVEIMREDLRRAGNNQLTARYYKGADHGLKVNKKLVENAFRDVSNWINGLPYTATSNPRIAGAEPVQEYRGQRVASAPKFASGMQLLWTIALGVSLVGVATVLIFVGSLRIRKKKILETYGLGKKLIGTGFSLVLAWVALLAYVMALAYYATSYQQNRLVVQGGWLIVQASALLAAWLLVTFCYSWMKKRPRLSPVAWIALTAGLIGNVVLILLLAYWGPYPSIL